jgi:hypothetical protein
MFTFFVAIKLCLLLWHVLVKQNDPLADVPADGVPFIVGGDLLICFLFAGCWLLLQSIETRFGGPARALGRAGRGLLYGGIVFFCVVSFQVARIYGEPLDIDLLRSADDLMVLRRSVWAYAGPMPLVLLAYGLLCVPLLGRRTAFWLGRRRWLRAPWQLWAATGMLCLGAATMQRVRLARIDTFGVKDNALVFFAKEYKPPYRPIDAPHLIEQMEASAGPSLRRKHSPPSLAVPSSRVERDFAYSGAVGRDFNVVMIQMESTSALHVDRESAPNITALIEKGLSFQRHVTVATQTRPATCGLYYSDYLPELGTPPSLVYGRPMPQPALAEVLKRAGYQTGVFHTGFLDYLELRYMFQDKGFDTLIGAREMIEKGASLAYSAGVHEEQTVEEMTAWIKARKGEKFFGVYLTEFPHHPYLSMANEKPFPEDSWLHRYKNSLHYADESVGRLMKFLEAEGLLEKTIIVVVGDHGETVSTYPVGHGLRVSAEEMRTPFVVTNPQLFPTSQQSRLNTSHLDVAPTIVTLLGLQPPAEWLGRNLMSQSIPAVLQFVSITHIRRTCVLDNGLLFVRDPGPLKSRIYDFSDGELKPLAEGDSRQRLADAYEKQSDWYSQWSVWRHLMRADQQYSSRFAKEDYIEPEPRTASHHSVPAAVMPGS